MPHLKKIKRPWQQSNKPKAGWTNTGNSFYHSIAWKAIRKRKINDIPYCEYCKERDNRIIEARVVDHFKPRRLWPELELSTSNLKSSCTTCHNSKSAHEKKCYTQSQWNKKAEELGWI